MKQRVKENVEKPSDLEEINDIVAKMSIDLLDSLQIVVDKLEDLGGSNGNFLINILMVTLSRVLFMYVDPKYRNEVLDRITCEMKEHLDMFQNILDRDQKNDVV